jgi:nucleoside-diphosphate-sugar epimerase
MTLLLSCRVDVRDVAKAHYLALTKPEADGERFIISAGPFCTQGQFSTLLFLDPALSFFF